MDPGGMKHEAIREYLATKSMWISTANRSPADPVVMR